MPKMDMSKEQAPKRKYLLPEGWRRFTILSCEPSVSKSGNAMFLIDVQDDEKNYVDTLYAVSVEGKRWFLKMILTACGVLAGQDGVYDWEAKDIIGKKVMGLVEHEPNTWINRAGVEIKTTQHRIVEFKTPNEAQAYTETEKAWDE